MIATLVWMTGVLLGTLLKRARREQRRRAAVRARRARAARVMLDELSAFATGLDLAIEHDSTTPIGDPTAVEAAWRRHRDALESVPAGDLDAIEHAVRDAVNLAAVSGSGSLADARTEILVGVDVLRGHLE